MKSLILAAIICASLCGPSASACRQLIPKAKFQNSDRVIDGVAHCLEVPGTCRLTVDRVLKGKKAKKGLMLNIAVNESPDEDQKGDAIIIIRRCPQTFEPWQSVTHGRFYLTVRDDGTLFAAHPADIEAEKN